MPTVTPNYGKIERPEHVQAECAVEYDYRADLPSDVDHYMLYRDLLRDKPENVWTPHNGGDWMVTRAEDICDKGQAKHNTFGSGPHNRVFAPLARAELALFLEEWVTRIPDFRLDPDKPFWVTMNSVPGLKELHVILD